jgi:outer membrane protein TolC
LDEISVADLKLPEVNLDVPLSVLANRPDLRAAEFRLLKAFKNVAAAEKAWLPDISLSSALDISGPNVGQLLTQQTGGLSLSIALPFLQWNSVYWNLRVSETEFESVRLDFEKALITALNEVETYGRAYQNSLRVLSNLEKKQAYDLNVSRYYRQRYESGAGELSDWLSALNTLNSSRLTLLNSRYQTLQYENMVYKALAGRYVDMDAE